MPSNQPKRAAEARGRPESLLLSQSPCLKTLAMQHPQDFDLATLWPVVDQVVAHRKLPRTLHQKTGYGNTRRRTRADRCERLVKLPDEFGSCLRAASLRDVVPNAIQVGTRFPGHYIAFHPTVALFLAARRLFPRVTMSSKNPFNAASSF